MTFIVDGTNGLTFPNSTTQVSAGQVLQVVQATNNSAISTSSSTFSDTGLSASITPKFSTSKILVMVTMSQCEKNTSNTSMKMQLLRGSSVIAYMADIIGYNGITTNSTSASACINYLDSPATTSSTTYKTQFGSQANTAGVAIGTSFGGGVGVSTMTLMEIAA